MIVLNQVEAGYDGKTVLKNVSFTVQDGENVALMAPSGFGKTTLLKVIAGLIPPMRGTVSGTEHKKIAFLFQEDRLLPWLTARENVAVVSDENQAKSWLERMEIDGGNQYPHQLSGGMQRRVALARAMAFDGDLLLLDEPFKGLDEALRGRIAKRILNDAPQIILAVHDREEAALMNARMIELKKE